MKEWVAVLRAADAAAAVINGASEAMLFWVLMSEGVLLEKLVFGG